MWIQVCLSVAAFVSVPYAVVKMTGWYARRCVQQSKDIVESKLREFQTIAQQYTKNGTASELQDVIESLEEIMDELQMLEDNNKSE